MRDYEDRLTIATPEGVPVELVLAGLGSRFTAALIDLVLKGLVIVAAILAASLLGEAGTILVLIVIPLVYLGYDIAFEVLAGGRTPGKRKTRLRVLRADGRAVDLLSSAIRNVIRLIDGITLAYLPGMLSILLTRRNQRLGDLAGRTIVINEGPGQSVPETRFTEPERGGFLPPGAAAPAAGPDLDLTGVSARDLSALRAFLSRRAALPATARADLAQRLAGAVRPRVGGATDGLADEELIELIVAGKDRA